MPAAQPPLPGEDEPTADAAPIEADQWRAINARFVELHVSGPGKTAKRMTRCCRKRNAHAAAWSVRSR